MLKEKAAKIFYFSTIAALLVLILKPFLEFIRLCQRLNDKSSDTLSFEADPNILVPFFALIFSILVAFMFVPYFAKLSKPIILYAASAIIFVGLELLVEHFVALANAMNRVFYSRAPVELLQKLPLKTIPLSIKLHYFIFSIALILIAITFLYNWFLYFKKGSPINKYKIILQGITTLLYSLAFVFVRRIEYEDYTTYTISGQSAISAVVCILFAAISMGLFFGSILEWSKKKKYIPSLVSLITVILIYIAEVAMLGGNLYKYGEGIFSLKLPYVGLSVINIIIIALPPIIVYLVLSKSSATFAQTLNESEKPPEN